MSARGSDKLALCLFGALAGVALVRATTMQARTPWWDLDPLLSPPAETAVLVSGQLLLDAFVWVVAGMCAMWAAARGQRVRVWLGLLVCFGGLGVLLHGRFLSPFVADARVVGDFRSLVVGSAWVSALVGAWAMTHLVRSEAVQRIAPGVLFGLAFLLLARGALQVFIEHAYTVRAFEADPAAYLARSGIEPGSAMARVFERRLRHPDAVGWFGLSNVYGGVAAACAVGMIGIAIGGWRGMSRGARWGARVCAAAGLGCVALSASKGGVAAVALGVLVVTVCGRHNKRLGRRWWGVVGLAGVFGVIAVVAVRGVIGERLGELSLLFRWHYLVASARIAAEFPVFGCGPARFQDAYLIHKVAINPEEVERAHNVIADWVATLGVFWWAMACVLVRMAWDAGCAVWTGARSTDAKEKSPSPDLASLGHPLPGKGEGAENAGSVHGDVSEGVLARSVLIVVGLALAVSIWVEQDGLEAVGALARLGAGCAWVGVAVALSRSARSARWAGIGLGGAAIALIAHGQIEVGMLHSGSAAWIFLVIGAAAGMRGGDAAGRVKKWVGLVGCGAGVVGCAAVVWWGVVPAVRWEGHLRGAADSIERGTFRESGDPLVLEMASEDLLRAKDSVPGDTQAYGEGLRLLTIAYSMRRGTSFYDQQTVEIAEIMKIDWPGRSKTWAMLASVYAVRAMRSGEAEDWRAVAGAWERAAEVAPYGMESRYRAMEAWVRAGDMVAARELGAEVVRLDALYRLDPLKQLSGERRRVVEGVVGGGGSP